LSENKLNELNKINIDDAYTKAILIKNETGRPTPISILNNEKHIIKFNLINWYMELFANIYKFNYTSRYEFENQKKYIIYK
jgi:hypothetical protein